MRIAFFEDSAAADFNPIALMRPVFELLCGHFSQRERILRTVRVTEWGAFVRPYLGPTFAEAHPESHVNEFEWLAEQPTLLINGRWLPDETGLLSLAEFDGETAGVIDGTVVCLPLDPLEAPLLSEDYWDEGVYQIARTRRVVEMPGRLLKRPWDLVNFNGERIAADFALRCGRSCGGAMNRAVLFGPQSAAGPQVAILGSADAVHIDRAASVDPFVVIDARHGPVSIEAGAKVQSFTRLEGPCHVGRESQLFRANVREGTSIGPVCRVGGEVEESILHGYANKYHDGFLGHAYVCPWVNLGALTTNSDLKNDYSAVKVPIGGQMVDTGSTKVGCFIGDHTKTALASLFNTGSAIGIFCMILPGGELLPKHIPPFCRVWHGELDEGMSVEQACETARVAMSRRNREFTAAEERLVRHLYTATRAEREQGLSRFREKAADRSSQTEVRR